MGPLLDGEGLLTDNDTGKAETFNAFFTSAFNVDDGLRDPGCPEREDHDGGNDKLPTDPERVQDLLLLFLFAYLKKHLFIVSHRLVQLQL